MLSSPQHVNNSFFFCIEGLSVWNVFSSTIMWSVVSYVKDVCINHSEESQFAVALNSSTDSNASGDSLILFNVASPLPIMSWKFPIGITIESLVYNNMKSEDSTSFVILTSDNELCTFGPAKEESVSGKTLLAAHDISSSVKGDLIACSAPSVFEQVITWLHFIACMKGLFI
jgi:hypothetical protein